MKNKLIFQASLLGGKGESITPPPESEDEFCVVDDFGSTLLSFVLLVPSFDVVSVESVDGSVFCFLAIIIRFKSKNFS